MQKKILGFSGYAHFFFASANLSSPRRRCESSHGRLVLCIDKGKACIDEGKARLRERKARLGEGVCLREGVRLSVGMQA